MDTSCGNEHDPQATWLAQALSFHQYNHLPQACQLYRAILKNHPKHPEALHMLGVALMQQGEDKNGIELIQDALALGPTPTMWLHLGTGLSRLSRHEDAISALNRALELAPENPDALNNLGVALAATGQHEQALNAFARALHLRTDFAACHSNRANSLRALHRINDAINAAEHALCLQPDNPDTLNSLGLALASALRTDEALDCFDQALRLSSRHLDALTNRARILRQKERFAEALADYENLIKLQPDNPHTNNDAGLTLVRLGRHEEALAHFDAALAINQNAAELHNNRGNALAELGRIHEALDSFSQAIRLLPDYAEAINNQANVMLAMGLANEALPLTERVCELLPGLPQGHNNRGLALSACDRHPDALDAFDQAISLRPDYAEALNNRGNTLEVLGQNKAAMRDYAAALKLHPDYPLARWNMSKLLLRQGQFEAGWQHYPARQNLPGTPSPRDFPMPRWQGQMLAGRSILLWCEQGLGDSILFCRYASLLVAKGATVFIEATEALYRLLTSLQGIHNVILHGNRLPQTDFHCPLPDLPGLMGTRQMNIPADIPYLQAPQAQSNAWRQKINSPSRRIAIACSGTMQFQNDRQKSIPLDFFTPLLKSGATLYFLQRDCRPQDEEFLAAHPDIIDLHDDLSDFADTAAVLAQMNLVISADNAIAHLAGALGCPLWLVLPSLADWHWQLNRSDTPWYPGARLFRQQSWGNRQDLAEQILHVFQSGNF